MEDPNKIKQLLMTILIKTESHLSKHDISRTIRDAEVILRKNLKPSLIYDVFFPLPEKQFKWFKKCFKYSKGVVTPPFITGIIK